MITSTRNRELLTVLVLVLVAVVAVLAYMVFQTNRRIEALAAKNETPASAHGDSHKGDDKTTVNLVPKMSIPDEDEPSSLFSTPFDPDHWEPFAEMDEMQRRIDAMFNDAFGRFGKTPGTNSLLKRPAFTPRMDLVDEGDRYVVRLDVPGAENSEIDVSLEGQLLSVEAASKLESENKDEDHALRRERRTGRFRRQVTLPEPVDADSLETQYDDGVLTVTIEKVK
jgi:HSP20 family protein